MGPPVGLHCGRAPQGARCDGLVARVEPRGAIRGVDGRRSAAADVADPPPPTAIERALVERGCNIPALATADLDTRQRCFDTQLALLRDDFGLNLKKLSAGERNALDAVCRRYETTHGRDA